MSWIGEIISGLNSKGAKRIFSQKETGVFEKMAIPESVRRSNCLTKLGCVVLDGAGRMAVSINGVRGPFHEGIIAGYPLFDLSGEHMVYSAVDGGSYTVSYDWTERGAFKGLLKNTPLLSSDGKKFLFVIRVTDGETLMINEKAAYEIPYLWSVVEGSPCFSDCGDKFALVIERNESKRAVINGKPDAGQFGWIESFGFYSPDGSSYAYMAVKSADRVVVLNGSELPYTCATVPVFAGKYEKPGSFSAEAAARRVKSCSMAFFVKRDDGHFAVVDGREGKKYKSIITYAPVFNPDWSGVAYAVEDADGKCFLVEGGREYPKFDDIYSPTIKFSPDGKNIIFRAVSKGRETVSLNGRPGLSHDAVTDDPFFSPDGRHYAYRASDGDSVFVVTDGLKGPEFEAAGKPVFAPEGGRTAYVTGKGDKFYVIDGEKTYGPYETVYNEPVFSPDGKHIAYCVNDGRRDMIAVDGEAGKPFERIINFEGTLRFTSPCTFEYMAVEKDKIIMVGEKI